MDKKILMGAAAAVVITSAAAFGAIGVSAQGSDMNQNVVQKLAEKFNLNESDVQAVFDQTREERHQEMETKYEDNLNTAVSEGKITEEQKTLILAKHDEIEKNREANRENWQNLTPEERRTQMQQQRDEMQTWADQNGINLSLIMGMGDGMRGPHGGFGDK